MLKKSKLPAECFVVRDRELETLIIFETENELIEYCTNNTGDITEAGVFKLISRGTPKVSVELKMKKE